MEFQRTIVVVVVGPAPGPVTRWPNGPNTPAAGGGVGGRVSVASCVEALFRGGRPRFRIVYQSPFAFVRTIYHVRPVALSPQKRTIPSSRLRKNSSKKIFFFTTNIQFDTSCNQKSPSSRFRSTARRSTAVTRVFPIFHSEYNIFVGPPCGKVYSVIVPLYH